MYRSTPRRPSPAGRMLALAMLVVVGLVVAGCGDDDAADRSASTPATADAASTTTPLTGEITVSAAASLTGAFTELGRAFQEAHPGTTVTFNFDSSGTLATQIQSGAPADVFASADTTNMDELTAAGLVQGTPTVFAHNVLAIVVKPGNPAGVASLADLATAGVVSLCADTAPCGKYADQILAEAGVTIPTDKVTRGQNVKATLTAVASGDADAGIVYVTDASASPDVDRIDIPAEDNAEASYPIAVVKETGNAALATAFVEFVSSAVGLGILEAAGFLAP